MQMGHIIAKLRLEKGISQRQLAKDLNVSAGVVGLWETNKRLPSLECFILLIDYFSVSADTLLASDRKINSMSYDSSSHLTLEEKKMYDTFKLLNEDNKDIIIGEAKKLLIKQREFEEKEGSQLSIAK